jgi:hypothetical protein
VSRGDEDDDDDDGLGLGELWVESAWTAA